ncbi:MAG: hypothetical protein ACXVA4_07685, partial [Ktedonobacterales bacterium]
MLLAGAGLIIVANLIALVPPLLLGLAIDGLRQHTGVDALTRLALLIVGVALVASVFQFCSRFVVNSVSRHIEYEMRTDLF